MGGGLDSPWWGVVTLRMAPCALHRTISTVNTTYQRLSRPPPIQKLGAENHMLQLNIQCS